MCATNWRRNTRRHSRSSASPRPTASMCATCRCRSRPTARWPSWPGFREGRMKPAVRIQQEDFSQDEEIGALKASSKRIGGIATFLGCARDFSEGREVSEISFDAYGSMALSELDRLRSDAIEKYGLLDARIVHRIGTVKGGENIVFIAAGAEHRVAALEACRWMIDELKQRVPIWKKEITPQGDAWVTPHP